jgi:hypothetical protein
MDKGKLIFDGSKSVENIKKVKREKKSNILHGLLFIFVGLFWILCNILILKSTASIWGILLLLIPFSIIFFTIGISMVLAALTLHYLKIYENGIVLPYREYLDLLLRRRKEIFLPFNDIKNIYENPKGKYISIKMKNFEKATFGVRKEIYSIDKDYLSLSDYKEIKSILKKKVPYNNLINYQPSYN